MPLIWLSLVQLMWDALPAGQFIASSPTLFPPEYVSEFQKCLDSTPPMPWSDVRPLIESELGKRLELVTPCAAGT